MTVSSRTKTKLAVYLTAFVLLCVFSLIAGKLAPHDAEFVDLSAAKRAPGGAYLLGTDWLGRCIWSRILAGASSSIFASLVIVVLSMVVGCAVGIVSGYAGGTVDEIIMRIVDVFLAFPGIVLSIAVAGMLGPGLKNGVLALAATGWTQYARLTRSYVLSLRQENFCQGGQTQRTERTVHTSQAHIPECHPAGGCYGNAAPERRHAGDLRIELSRTELVLGRMGEHAFRGTQSDAAVSLDCALSRSRDFPGHDPVQSPGRQRPGRSGSQRQE